MIEMPERRLKNNLLANRSAPFLYHNADGAGCQGRRSRSYTLDIPPQQVLIRHTLSEIDGQSRMDAAPVLPAAGPLFRDVDHRQIQHFEKAVID